LTVVLGEFKPFGNMEVMTRVVVVFQGSQNSDRMDQPSQLVDAFLYRRDFWTLTHAASRHVTRLVARVVHYTPTDETSQHLLHHDFNKALVIALQGKDMLMAKLLISTCHQACVTRAV
jgi:hypothetical protein